MVEPHAFADYGGLAYHNARAVIDEEAAPNAGARMYVDSGFRVCDLRDDACYKAGAQLMQFVGQAMMNDCDDTGIADQNFIDIARCRVAGKCCFDITVELAPDIR